MSKPVAAAAHAPSDPGSTLADIQSRGRVRIGIGLVPTFATKDPATGELRGIAIELGRALAERLGVELVPVTYPSPANLLDALKAGAFEIAFLGIDPVREEVMDFSVPYLQVDSTLLVAPGLDHRSVEDLDRPGVRIAATRNSIEDFALTRSLKAAEILRVDSSLIGLGALTSGEVAAVAVPRPVAIVFSERVPGSHVLDDRYAVAMHALAVPKGRSDQLEYINGFMIDAKKSGFVQRAIERVGLRGAQIAPD
jgi:polar amino acid transport system substrate-binding protein